jgi:hypothetical protein
MLYHLLYLLWSRRLSRLSGVPAAVNEIAGSINESVLIP